MQTLRELVSHPLRLIYIALGGAAGIAGLALASAQSKQIAIELIGVLLIAVVMLVVNVPARMVLWLTAAAILAIVGVSAIMGVVAAGPLSVVILVLGLLVIGWTTRGVLGVGLGLPPPSRGARFATIAELREAEFFSPYGWPLGSVQRHIVRLPEHLERESVICCAAPGSFKSSALAIPAILSEADRPPDKMRVDVVVDPKNELTEQCLPRLQKTHQCMIWDPSSNTGTVAFDPFAGLPPISDESFVGEMKTIARAWFDATRGGSQHSNEPPFFVNQPRSLMEALFIAFRVTHPAGTFVEMATQWLVGLSIEKFQEVLDNSPHPAVHASAEALRAVGLNSRTIGPIWGDILQRFDGLIDPRVVRSMTGPPIDWQTLLTQAKPAAIFLRISAHDSERLAPLISMAMGQLYREITKVAARYVGNQLPRAVRVIADEFGNLPRIYGIEAALGTLRSYGVGHLFFVQSTAQLDFRYSRDISEALQNPIVTKIILGGAAYSDAKAFSDRCGEIVEPIGTDSDTESGFFKRSRSHSYTPERRPLISTTEIIHMRDTVLISTRGLSPICAQLNPYFQDEKLVQQLEADRREYERSLQHGQEAPPPLPQAATAVLPPVYAENANTRAAGLERDVPPPRCSEQEWRAAPGPLVAACWALQDAMIQLALGQVSSLDELEASWSGNPQSSPPALYAKITAEDRTRAPNVAAYVTELALRLCLVEEESILTEEK